MKGEPSNLFKTVSSRLLVPLRVWLAAYRRVRLEEDNHPDTEDAEQHGADERPGVVNHLLGVVVHRSEERPQEPAGPGGSEDQVDLVGGVEAVALAEEDGPQGRDDGDQHAKGTQVEHEGPLSSENTLFF